MKARSGLPTPRRRDRALNALCLALLRRRHAKAAGTSPPPLFIIGSGRSGNTLVRRVLMASGGIHIPPETFVLGDIIEGWMRTALPSRYERTRPMSPASVGRWQAHPGADGLAALPPEVRGTMAAMGGDGGRR